MEDIQNSWESARKQWFDKTICKTSYKIADFVREKKTRLFHYGLKLLTFQLFKGWEIEPISTPMSTGTSIMLSILNVNQMR